MSIEPNATPGPEVPVPDPAEICTLSPRDLDERLAWIRREILPYAVRSDRLERGRAFEIRAEPGLAEKVDQLITLERDCCRGVSFQRVASTTPGQLRLEILGVDPDAPIFASAPDDPQRTAPRLAKAASAGIITSLVVCCVLPVAAVALLGAAAAAPIATLDRPVPIAVTALGSAGAAWVWMTRGRRSGAARERACGPDC